jgi:Putative beta-barrel porin-2, OmpL-like. bbp2
MTRPSWTSLRIAVACLGVAAWQFGGAARAQQAAPPSPPAAAAAPAAPAANPMTTPAMAGPLVANPDPLHLNVTPFFGPVYVTGAASGLLLGQTEPVLGLDRSFLPDISNAQVALQKTSGVFQFFLEPGAYSLPTLGIPYRHTTDVSTSTNLFGGLPVAWGKIAPTDNFSIQGGKLPTLIGAEYMFTFQNMNIERGLLWAQENVINRGVQANLTTGPVAWSLSLNDGFYTGQYNYLTGSAAWTINSANSLALTGGGPLSRVTTTTGPSLPQYNNSTIVEASYTYSAAPWTITPYVQYTHVDADPGLGIVASASTIGGAVLANYAITDKVNLAGRWEYIGSSGAAGGAGLLGYGPDSSAMSFTLTPTYQNGIFFVRGEASLTQLFSITSGLGFGSGNSRTQARFLVETGVVF